jgi:glyoxylase-like metal-dependent hydrolase (beta-lactamase superfamily II)
VGGLEALLRVWDVPVFAHTAELPFLTGRANYPSPDPTVAPGILARFSPPIPEAGIDLGDRVRPLTGGRVPGLPDWRWIHTPGHSPGHVSLFRTSDRLLIAGDALATTSQRAIYSAMEQPQELAGPPAYFTIDWDKAEASFSTLASLRPTAVAAGHGETIKDASLPVELAVRARNFEVRVRPAHGRYVLQPALVDDDQSARVAARRRSVRWGTLSGVAAATVAGTWLYRRFGRRQAGE